MIELLFSALITILPDYLCRHHRQGKRLGHEITFYSFWCELRWGISCCVVLATILSDMPGRLEYVYVANNQRVSAGDPIFRLDTSRQRAAAETAWRRIDEIDAALSMADGLPPGSSCIGVAYTSRAKEIAAGEITGFSAFNSAIVDRMGIANAFVLRIQALLLPIKVLVFPT